MRPPTRCTPLPLVAMGWGGGREIGAPPFAMRTTPLPNPPPQGGREQTEFAALADSISHERALSVVFQLRAIPFAERRRSLVSALAEVEQRLARRGGASHIVIPQQELREIGIVGRRRRANGRFGKSWRLRRSIGKECWLLHHRVARPPAHAAHLVRIGLLRDPIGAGNFRRAATGK